MPSRREALGLPLSDLIAAGLERLHESGEYEERSPIDPAYNCVALRQEIPSVTGRHRL